MDALQVLREGTGDVKQSKINTLIEEYELFCMKPGKYVTSMQMKFHHIVNKLEIIFKTTSNQDYNNKIWDPCIDSGGER